jgi:hypothetical protein
MYNTNTEDERLMRRYLLGQLVDREQEAVEQRVMTDAEFFRHLSFVEDDLMDEYAAGLLVESERANFETRFIPVPKRRHRLRVAELLTIRARDRFRPKREVEVNTASWRSELPSRIVAREQTRRISLSVALILLLVPALLWMFFEVKHLEQQLKQAQAAQPTSSDQEQLQQAVIEMRNQLETMSKALEREQSSRQGLEREMRSLKAARSSGREPVSGAIASFLLTPGMLRDEGETNKIGIPYGSGRMRLKLRLDDQAREKYRVVLSTIDAKLIWQHSGLKAQRLKGGSYVSLILPYELLKDGDYMLKLEGAARNRLYERITTYHFTVVKQ